MFDNGKPLDLFPALGFNTRAACSSLSPDAPSDPRDTASTRERRNRTTPVAHRRLAPARRQRQSEPLSTAVGADACIVERCFACLERAAPQRVCLPLLFEKRAHRFCRKVFRQSLYFPTRDTEPCTTPFITEAAILPRCRFPGSKAISCRPPVARSGKAGDWWASQLRDSPMFTRLIGRAVVYQGVGMNPRGIPTGIPTGGGADKPRSWSLRLRRWSGRPFDESGFHSYDCR